MTVRLVGTIVSATVGYGSAAHLQLVNDSDFEIEVAGYNTNTGLWVFNINTAFIPPASPADYSESGSMRAVPRNLDSWISEVSA